MQAVLDVLTETVTLTHLPTCASAPAHFAPAQVLLGPHALPLPAGIPRDENERQAHLDDERESECGALGVSVVGRVRNERAFGVLVDVFLDTPWDVLGIAVGQQLHYLLSAHPDNLFLILPLNSMDLVIKAFPQLSSYRQAIALQLLEQACIKRAVRKCLMYSEFDAMHAMLSLSAASVAHSAGTSQATAPPLRSQSRMLSAQGRYALEAPSSAIAGSWRGAGELTALDGESFVALGAAPSGANPPTTSLSRVPSVRTRAQGLFPSSTRMVLSTLKRILMRVPAYVHVLRETGLFRGLLGHVDHLASYLLLQHKESSSSSGRGDENSAFAISAGVGQPLPPAGPEEGSDVNQSIDVATTASSSFNLSPTPNVVLVNSSGGAGVPDKRLPLLYDPISYQTNMECLVLLVNSSEANFQLLLKESAPLFVLLSDRGTFVEICSFTKRKLFT